MLLNIFFIIKYIWIRNEKPFLNAWHMQIAFINKVQYTYLLEKFPFPHARTLAHNLKSAIWKLHLNNWNNKCLAVEILTF